MAAVHPLREPSPSGDPGTPARRRALPAMPAMPALPPLPTQPTVAPPAARSVERLREEVERLLDDPDAIRPVFQPIVSLPTATVVGYEALTRFAVPGGRSVLGWFAQARRCGLGAQLQAKAIAAALTVPGRPAGRYLSLNASPSALLTDEVLSVLPLDLSDLVIEITEQEQLSDPGPIGAVVDLLRRRGARIAIDDTGAAYAGLQRMLETSPDLIKLDKALVSGLDHDPAKAALVEAMVRFARRTGAAICAEGVETPDELVTLADLDVTFGQGHLLGEPARQWSEVDATAAALCRGTMAQALRGSSAGRSGSGDDADSRMERLSHWMTTVASLDELAHVVEDVAAMLHADRVLLSLLDREDGRTIRTLSAQSWQPTGESFDALEYPLTLRVLQRQIAAHVSISDRDADRWEVALLRRYGYRSMLMLPVCARHESLGLLEAYSASERPWTRTEIRRARVISNQLALAIGALSAGPSRARTPHDRPAGWPPTAPW